MDFSLLGQGPQFQSVLAAFETGRAARKERDVTNALAMYASGDHEGGINALAPYDPVTAMKLRDDQAARQLTEQKRAVFREADPAKRMNAARETGDEEIITAVMAMGEADRAAAKEKTEAIGKTFFRLRTMPLQERGAELQRLAPSLIGLGMPREDVGRLIMEPSDAAIDEQIFSAQDMDKLIDQANKDRTFKAEREEKERDFELRRTDTEADNKRDDQRLGLEGQRVGLERQRVGLEGQRVQIARAAEARQGADGGMTPQQARQQSMALRKEFNSQPDVKNFNDVATSYDVISTLAKAKPSAANDLSLIFSYMKMLDPGSVVREGEFANAQNAAGIPDRIRNAYNKAVSGQMLNPKQRGEFTQGAANVYQARRGRYDQLAQQYQGYADSVGLPGADVIQPRPAPGGARGPTASQRPSLDQIFK